MIEPRYQNLNVLFSDRVFRIPKYQRYYSWGEKQRSDLFSDIMQLKKTGGGRDHFMATIVCYRTDEIKEIGSKEYRIYDIVDGQQRLTTVIMLIKAIHMKLDDGEEKNELGKIVVKTDGNLILLQTNNTNKFIFNDFLRNGKIPKKSDLKTHADQNIYEGIIGCIKYVEQWLEEYDDVLSLLRIVRNKLGFVVFDTDDAGVVYSVFEVLNSRGLAVDWLDKCKSSLMGIAYELAETDESRKTFINDLHDLWGDIYQEIANYPIPGHEILRVTATLYMGTESGGKPLKAETALIRLKGICSTPVDTIDISKKLLEVAKKLVYLQSNVYLAPVTNVLQARILAVAISLAENISDTERKKVLNQWEKVTFRIYGIFGKDSRSKVGDFIKLANKILNKASGASRYSEIIAAVRELGADYSISQAIDEGLKEKNVYDNNQEVLRYLLWRYEEYLARQAGSGAIINEEFKKAVWTNRSANESIEHIMPQNPEAGGAWAGKIEGNSDDYKRVVNGLGNLILLPQSLNSEAKRQGFIAKKNVYKKSEGLRLVQEILKESDWSYLEINKREKKLLAWVETEWGDIPD